MDNLETNAMIIDTELGYGERDMLVLTLTLRGVPYPYGEKFGGYLLYNPGYGDPRHEMTGFFIYRLLKAVGVENWEDLKGKYIRVKLDPEKKRVFAIGHILGGIQDWFDFEEALKERDERIKCIEEK